MANLIGTIAIGVLVLVLGATRVHLRTTDFIVVPITLVLANFAEWRMHKHVLHRRRWPFRFAYDIHTAMHHVRFVKEEMALRGRHELGLVMMPIAGVAALVLGTVPLAGAVAFVFGPNAGWLFFITATETLVLYELLHLAYHLPEQSFVGRRAIIRALRKHHATHHDPRLMQRYNFNVTIPLFDWIFGTAFTSRES